MSVMLRSQKAIIFGLCAFMAFLSFKPSEPYLSEYLICNKDTQEDYCAGFSNINSCNNNIPCSWQGVASVCGIVPCANVTISECGNSDYDYCTKKDHTDSAQTCENENCYKNFSEDEVNDEIYPWSTYAYLPFLLVLGPLAELFSYRAAILVGICGRLVTRFLLLYGKSILDMQMMQVAYAFGTAAEDVLAAYVFYTLNPAYYQLGTSYIKATSLATNVVAGVLGDLLVVEGNVSLRVLMWISAVSVSIGFIVGIAVLQPALAGPPASSGERSCPLPSDGAVASCGKGQYRVEGQKRELCIDHVVPSAENIEFSVNAAGVDNPVAPSVSEDETSRADSPDLDTPLLGQQDRSLPPFQSIAPTIDNLSTTYINDHLSRQENFNKTQGQRAAPPSASVGHTNVQDKLNMFREQLLLLRMAFRSRTLTALVLYWVVGNAVFMTLYDYEVAVYAELNGGSNAWNGSVLAVMLLAGTAGALLPTWLKHDTYEIETGTADVSADSGGIATSGNTRKASTTGIFVSTPEFIVGMRIIIAGLLSCVNLLLFVLSWEVVASVSFLALYFATWQYINVVVFARIALALKVAQFESQSVNDAPTRCPATGDVKNAADRRARTIVPLGIVPLETVTPRSPASATSAESVAGVASILKLQNPILNAGSDHSSHKMEAGSWNFGLHHNVGTIRNTSVLDEVNIVQDLTGRQISQDHHHHHHQQNQTLSLHFGADTSSAEGGTEPPYSVAIVSIIALNVVVQIILQAITFSGLALALRTSCWIFVLTFCVATAMYIICLLILFGGERIITGLQKSFVCC